MNLQSIYHWSGWTAQSPRSDRSAGVPFRGAGPLLVPERFPDARQGGFGSLAPALIEGADVVEV